jgi:hypothetical protein
MKYVNAIAVTAIIASIAGAAIVPKVVDYSLVERNRQITDSKNSATEEHLESRNNKPRTKSKPPCVADEDGYGKFPDGTKKLEHH